jgi:hypothetical protein
MPLLHNGGRSRRNLGGGGGHKEKNYGGNSSKMRNDSLKVEMKRRLNPENKSATKAFKGEK